ncbi:MAG: DUF2332 domain-containing protein [Euzebya sp.]
MPRPRFEVWNQQIANFETKAQACERLGSPMYADLLTRVAEDLKTGGPAVDVLAGYQDEPGPAALALRLMGSVHRLVLARQAGALAAFYPSVGGVFEPESAWPHFRQLLADKPEQVREWLDRPPQTNEVGRSAALYGGLHVLAQTIGLPLRLMEIGSSGGLNLRCDHYAYVDSLGEVHGDPDSPVRLGWKGRQLSGPAPRITQRVGSDVAPIDVTTTEGRLALTAYVWPDQHDRHERLRGAFAIAGRVPAEVRTQDAASFVDHLELREGQVTVLAHSVMWQYLPTQDQQRITDRLAALGAKATATTPLAHLRAEPMRPTPDADHEFLVALTTWPADPGQAGLDQAQPTRRIIGELPPHGTPATWYD